MKTYTYHFCAVHVPRDGRIAFSDGLVLLPKPLSADTFPNFRELVAEIVNHPSPSIITITLLK